MKTAALTAIALATLLTACSHSAKPVSYYTAHPEERQKVMAVCRDDMKMMQEDGDCRNAGQADGKAADRAMRGG